MPVTPDTSEAEVGGSRLEVGGSRLEPSPDKVIMRPYLKNKLKAKGLGAWLSCKALSSISSTIHTHKSTWDSWLGQHTTVVPATQEAEAGGLIEPRGLRSVGDLVLRKKYVAMKWVDTRRGEPSSLSLCLSLSISSVFSTSMEVAWNPPQGNSIHGMKNSKYDESGYFSWRTGCLKHYCGMHGYVL
jgi:hypothetical protein